MRRMFDAEFKEKRDKGLCFRCDERYFQGHRCKIKEKRELNLIIAGEEGDCEEMNCEEEVPEVETKALEVADNVELALRSIYGFLAPRMMKLKGIVVGNEMIVLIDCGATHNFIHQRLAEELKLQVVETSNYRIVVGNGTTIKV